MMRFADGAVRAAYNIQLGVTPDTGLIVAAAATDRRNDTGLAVPVLEQIKDRLKILPRRLLADTHYATKDDIVDLDGARGHGLYAGRRRISRMPSPRAGANGTSSVAASRSPSKPGASA